MLMIIDSYQHILNNAGTLNDNILILLICLLYYPVLLILFLLSRLVKLIHKHIKNRYLKNMPIIKNPAIEIYAFIFSYYFTGKMPIVCGRGLIKNLHYNIYKANENIEIYRIGLDFDTTAHIVGISKTCNIDKTMLENYLLVNDMKITTLEGDFSSRFDIYVDDYQNGITQYIIDPGVMECIENNLNEDFWEISDDDLYIAHTFNNSKEQDSIKEISDFIDQIRPAFYKSIKRQWSDAGETPYGGYEDKPYLCPICNKDLIKNKYWYECPGHDGIMINGRNIVRVNDSEITPLNIIKPPKPHGILKCPNCHNELQPTNYQNGNTIIDSCVKCTIRWLDSGEINKIAPSKSNQ